jgi:predicted MFS family arabinose efflux permease
MDHRRRAAVAGSLGILCLAVWTLSALSMLGAGPVATVVSVGAIVVWGAFAAVLPPMLQGAAIRTSPDEPEHASALYVTAFQSGIVLGSMAGGLVYEHIGSAAVLATTAVLFAVTLVGVLARGNAFGSERSIRSSRVRASAATHGEHGLRPTNANRLTRALTTTVTTVTSSPATSTA